MPQGIIHVAPPMETFPVTRQHVERNLTYLTFLPYLTSLTYLTSQPRSQCPLRRMKEQVKTRMEILLDQETKTRKSSASSSREASTSGSSKQGDNSKAPQGGQRGSLLGSAPASRRDSSNVGMKADLVFHSDTGELAALGV